MKRVGVLGENRREKEDIMSIVMFLRGMNGNHRPAGL